MRLIHPVKNRHRYYLKKYTYYSLPFFARNANSKCQEFNIIDSRIFIKEDFESIKKYIEDFKTANGRYPKGKENRFFHKIERTLVRKYNTSFCEFLRQNFPDYIAGKNPVSIYSVLRFIRVFQEQHKSLPRARKETGSCYKKFIKNKYHLTWTEFIKNFVEPIGLHNIETIVAVLNINKQISENA